MPGPQLPQNLTFKETLKSAVDLGSTLPRPKRRKKSVDVSRFKGIDQGLARTPVADQFTNLGRVSTPFGGSTRMESFHPALDIAAPSGTPISAFAGGTVTKTRGGQRQGGPDFGNFVVITDDQGNNWRYSHLNEGLVPLGSQVTAGQKIGTIGRTGQVYSPSGGDPSHLDLRIFNTAKKLFIQPSTLINK